MHKGHTFPMKSLISGSYRTERSTASADNWPVTHPGKKQGSYTVIFRHCHMIKAISSEYGTDTNY